MSHKKGLLWGLGVGFGVQGFRFQGLGFCGVPAAPKAGGLRVQGFGAVQTMSPAVRAHRVWAL